MKLTNEEFNILTVALDHMQEYLDDLNLEPMSEIFDLDSKYKAFETLKCKLRVICITHKLYPIQEDAFGGSVSQLKEKKNA